MPLPDQLSLLCIAIEDRARREADNLTATARKQADNILDSAKKEIKRQLEERMERERETAAREASRIVDAADLKARQFILREKKRLLAGVMKEAEKKLADIRTSAEYPDILAALIQKAASGVPGARCMIQVNGEDRAILTSEMLQTAGSNTGMEEITVLEDAAAIQGGCLAYSEDMRQVVDYSFEALLNRAEPALMNILATEFLEEKDGSRT